MSSLCQTLRRIEDCRSKWKALISEGEFLHQHVVFIAMRLSVDRRIDNRASRRTASFVSFIDLQNEGPSCSNVQIMSMRCGINSAP